MEIHGNWFFFDDGFRPASDFIDCTKQTQNRIYEVLRVVNGKVLFIADHLKRFQVSCKDIGLNHSYSDDFIDNVIRNTITKNNIAVCNIRFEVLVKENHLSFACFLVPWKYPPDSAYEYGVRLGGYEIERPNPHIKQSAVNNKVRLELSELFSKHDYYEVLLINHNGYITEGSRSNVFFVKDQVLFSPPSEKMLEGITRKKVLELAGMHGINYIEKDIPFASAHTFDACFVTGTSPKILPVKSINEHEFDIPNAIVKQLMNLFDALIQRESS